MGPGVRGTLSWEQSPKWDMLVQQVVHAKSDYHYRGHTTGVTTHE